MAAARRRAGRLARQVRDSARDRDDHCQDLLVDLISRADRFDPERGSWGAFVSVVTRHATLTLLARTRSSVVIETISPDDLADPAGSSETAALLSIDVNSARRRLPPSLCEVLDAIAEEDGVTDAQRASGMPAASFYRALRQLRLRLIAAGLAPRSAINSRRFAAASR